MNDNWMIFLLCVSAFLAGGMNSIAGGGTLLTFPALLTVVSYDVANATSTVALMPGSMAGAWGYRKEVKVVRSFVLMLLPSSLLGGALGALLMVWWPNYFKVLVPWLVLTAAVLFVVQQPISVYLKRKQHGEPQPPGALKIAGLVVFQFLVAVYGGYFGAGIGILMLAALGFMGVGDIHKMNAVKTCLATAINAVSVVIFIANDLVNWKYAIPMVISAIVGGYCGARVARKLPAKYVRWFVIAIGFGLALYCFVKQYNAV